MLRRTDHVVLQCDRNYLFALAVAVSSLAEQHRSSDLTLAIAAEGFDDSDRTGIEALAGNHQIKWLSIDPSALDDIEVGAGLHRAALSRFLLPDALPADLERVLYLDVDLTVNGDLGELLEMELEPQEIVAAVRDAYIGTFWAPKGPPLDLAPVDPTHPYFNAGVVLIDLEKWREETISERCIRLLRERELRFIDQCAQNVVLAGRWKRLHPRWNLQSRHFAPSGVSLPTIDESRELAQAAARPAVIHYTGAKPWQVDCVHPFADSWRTLAARHGIVAPSPPTATRPSRERVRNGLAHAVDRASRAAGSVGLDVRLRRHTNLVVLREQLAKRTNGRIADGPFRGAVLGDHSQMPDLDQIGALLGLAGAGPALASAFLAAGERPALVAIGSGVPAVIAIGVQHLAPEAVQIPFDVWSSDSEGVELVVCSVTEMSEIAAIPDGLKEAWILVDSESTPSALAHVVDSLMPGFEVAVVDDPYPGEHHRMLFRDLGPAAAERIRGLLADRRRWIVASRRSADIGDSPRDGGDTR